MADIDLLEETTLEDLFFLKTQISQGIHGRVFEGIDRESPKQKVAVKEISLPPGDSDEIWMKFTLEAGVLAGLNGEGIPRLHKYLIENDKAYLIWDWVEGENIEETLRNYREPLPVFDVLTIMQETAGILKVLHSEKYRIAHGDIKPVNLKIPYPGKIALVDLGSQEICNRYDRKSNSTPNGFISPEAFQGKPEFRSDIYSLFAVGHYLLRGIKPVNFPPFSFPPLQDYNPNVTDKVSDFFRKGLSNNPDDRYQSIEELLNEINECIHFVPTDSIYVNRFNCPACKAILPRGVRMCFRCGIDFGIYDGTDNPDNYIRRGKEYLTEGKIIRADRCFYQAFRLGRESIGLLTLIARCRFLAGEREPAKGMLKNLINRYPSSSIPRLELNEILLKEGGMDTA